MSLDLRARPRRRRSNWFRTNPRCPVSDMTQIAVRLPADLLERIEAHAELLRARHPGLSLSRADVVRSLLAEALAAAESA